jgi:hypothetical protein
MELTPGIKPTDPQGGGGHRDGTSRFHKKKPDQGPYQPTAMVPQANAEVPDVDPLLAELDRMRAIDPGQSDSALYRKVQAQKAYQQ